MTSPGPPTGRIVMAGSIVSSGFASGDRVVVGHWRRSPLGPLTDIMWASPSGRRTLYVPTAAAGEFVSSVYGFDEVVVVDFTVAERRRRRSRELRIAAGPVALSFGATWSIPIPGPRPAWFTRRVEGPIADALLGVRTYGVSPTGVEEWYRATRYSPLRSARASRDGLDLGAKGPVHPSTGFGFSEPPPRPSWVHVSPVLRTPAG